MQSLANLLTVLGPWTWLIVAGIFIALDILIPGVYLLWFGLAALIVGAVALATPLEWHVQLILFAVIAVVMLFLVRRFTTASPSKTDSPDLNVRGAQYIGRIFTVEESIVSGRGKVRVGDTVWLAKGPDAPKGALVRVTAVDGTMLVVEGA